MWTLQLLFLAALMGVPPSTGQERDPPDTLADIVVKARPGPPPPAPERPVDFLARYCAEPMRQTGRFADLAVNAAWLPLDPAARARFGVIGPADAAYGYADTVGGRTLLMKQERLVRPGDGMVEQRCTLVVIGGEDQPAQLRDAISRFIGGPGTQRHVGASDGAPAVKGWQQWLWTAYPRRGAKRWQLVTRERDGRAGGTYLVVTDAPAFYARHDYIFFDLKVRVGTAVPLAVASFVKVSAPEKRSRR